MPDLSVLIPARNEMFLRRTIRDILAHREADTEIIAVLDGAWADPPIEDHEQVTLVYHPESIGQRAATNEAARLSQAQFVMKCDAHCSFAQGFDRILMADCERDWCVMPEMRNLHAFDWVCKSCGKRTYQGPIIDKCVQCGGTEHEMDVVWQPRAHTRNSWYRFDSDLHFQYWKALRDRPESKGQLTETMSLLGACWMMHRDRYWELGGLDEAHGSWGQMGTELSCKVWLSGGRLLTNRKTWFAHLFRTQPGFGFPYPNPGVRQAREYSKWLWLGDNWPGAQHPLQWLLDKFAPVPGWEHVPEAPAKPVVVAESPAEPEVSPVLSAEPTVGVLYYTCNTHREDIEQVCRANLRKAVNGLALGTVSREPIDYGDWNIVVAGERGPLTMHRQILAGLESLDADYVYLCESDVLYHPSHFEFVPPRADTVYYNTNLWRVRADGDGLAVWTDFLQQVSGICASRELLLAFYRERTAKIERDGFDRHYEPGHKTGSWRTDNWLSRLPNVDLRHSGTLTRSKWSPDDFRNKRYAAGWQDTDSIPGWGFTRDRVEAFLEDVRDGRAPLP